MELFYKKMGVGQPLIILHGLYGSSDNWHGIDKALSGNFEVYIIDQRNHGRSPHDPILTYQAMRDDLLKFMDQHNLWKVTLVGHSMGGKTAMFFASAFPHRISSMVIIDMSPRSYKSLSKPSTQVLSHLNIIQALLSLNLDEIRSRSAANKALAESISSENVRNFLLKNLIRKENNGFTWTFNIAAIQKALPHLMDGLDHGFLEKGQRISGFPVLFIRGENSDYILEEDEKSIANLFQNASIITIPGAGHWVQAEQPELFLEALNKFLLKKP
jgi:esterase